MPATVEGLQDVKDDLEKLIVSTNDRQIMGLLAGEAEEIKAKAESNAPGSLRSDSLEIIEDDKFGPAALIQFTEEKYYGIFPEYGTKFQGEQAFVRGAAFEQQPDLEDAVEKKLDSLF